MSEQQRFEAGRQARRQIVSEGGRENGAGRRLDAVVRYLKGAGAGGTRPKGRTEPPHHLDPHELRRRIVDRVIDAGGEVSAVLVTGGTVLVRGRVGCRSEVAMLDRELRRIPGVSRLELHLRYDIDDVAVHR